MYAQVEISINFKYPAIAQALIMRCDKLFTHNGLFEKKSLPSVKYCGKIIVILIFLKERLSSIFIRSIIHINDSY
jgi:hypothetical protein